MTSDKKIECAEHGDQDGTFVCIHLVAGVGQGFHHGYDDDDPDAMFPDAWCDACEAVLEEEDGWTERLKAAMDIQLLCAGCYMDRRRLNWPGATFADQEELIQESIAYLQERQDEVIGEFRLTEHERFYWEQGTGQIVFSNRGVDVVRADFDFIGSISKNSDTWLWSWANTSDDARLKQSTQQVRDYGEEHRLLKLACAMWPARETDGWEMSAVTARLLGAQAVYRTPNDKLLSFLLLRNLRWVQ
ncbi:MAG: hypothetical protein H6717_40625 [Polyangiaceae bacterium]|nr:hypothetical protein [Polyangiaceae bacterium]